MCYPILIKKMRGNRKSDIARTDTIIIVKIISLMDDTQHCFNIGKTK